MLTVLPDIDSDESEDNVAESGSGNALDTALLSRSFHHPILSAIRSQSFSLVTAEQLDMIYNRKSLAAIVTIGFFRDVIWSWQTVKNQNYFAGKLNGFWGPTLTQMLGSLPTFFVTAPLILFTFSGSAAFQHHKREWMKRLAIFSLASWSSIPVWNGALLLGTWTGAKLGLNTLKAQYFAGMLTGPAETVWQNALVIPFLFTQPINRMETLLNTLGGAVWQWVLLACLENWDENENREYIVSPLVALCVAVTTLLMTLLALNINNICHKKRDRAQEDGNIRRPISSNKNVIDRNRLFARSTDPEQIISPRRYKGLLP